MPTVRRGVVAPSLPPVARRCGARELARVKEEANILKHRVRVLERSERSLKRKLAERKEELKDVMTELQGTRTELILAEEKLGDMGTRLHLVQREFEKYRGWWLTEYYSLKVVLELVSRRDNVEEIAASSRARFFAHSRLSRA
jgi:chromosome segregation ATPase